MESPKHIGVSWSSKEELQLLQNLNVGCTISTIAVQHKRSEGGIRSRINVIAQRMHDQGIDYETIINTVKITKKNLIPY
jgi:DNA-binding NarL/FixJ family response regulator